MRLWSEPRPHTPKMERCCFVLATSSNAQGLILVLCWHGSGNQVLGIKLRSVVCKARALPWYRLSSTRDVEFRTSTVTTGLLRKLRPLGAELPRKQCLASEPPCASKPSNQTATPLGLRSWGRSWK